MHVRDIMTHQVVSCGPETDLAKASELLWTNDCGVLPVVEDGRLIGMITDRDICIALGTRDQPASRIRVSDVAATEIEACAPDVDIHTAMAHMRRAKVRRLPVVNEQSELIGLLGLNDIILATDRKRGQLTYEEVLNTVKAVSEHRAHRPEPQLTAAVA